MIQLLQSQMEDLQSKWVDVNNNIGDMKQRQFEIKQCQQEQNF
jgi:hypothetical protein